MSEVVSNDYDLSTISSGVDYLKDGYIEYAKEVITNRALPNIYDGLKPVNRRILVTLMNDGKKNKNYMKCARVSGNVLALHPHGDASVYAALVLMTQKNGSLAFPLVDGSGEFGGVYKTDPPAAMRYTEAKIHSNATNEYFGEMNGIKMIPNFDATLSEPEVLPVSFPAVLVNSSTGIAVGFKSSIPSFNFNDVCDLVTEFIEKGSCSTIIEPDFVTGGYYVRDEKELRRLMTTGKGKLKLRGRAITVGKEIQVTEVPFSKTIQGLIKQINDGNFSCIRNAYDTDDFEHGAGFTVDCTAKNKVDEALLTMYKDTDFQYSYSADITVVVNGTPKRLGVWQIIEEWVKWRREVLIKEYKTQIEDWKERFKEANAFMNVVNSFEKRMELVRIIASEGREKGRQYVRDNFTREEVPEDLITFVSGRPLPDYHDGGKCAKDYANGVAEINRLQSFVDDIDSVILGQMKRLKATYGNTMQRRTEVTETDYNFEEIKGKEEKIIDTSSCGYSFKNGFLRKTRYLVPDESNEFEFEGFANDTLIALDNRGRILRIYCSELPLYGQGDLGLYVPRYCNLNESDDYRITWIGRMTGQTLMLLYKDGNVGFIDTTEWTSNNRSVKVLEKGISPACADKLGYVLESVPPVLMVSDTEGRLGWCMTDEIKRKDRTAKTRVFNLVKGAEIDSFAGVSITDLPIKLGNMSYYKDKLKELESPDDWRGSDDDFIMMR